MAATKRRSCTAKTSRAREYKLELSENISPASAVRILIVEDNVADVRLLTEMLSEAQTPFAIEQVSRLALALDRLAQGGINLVLTDLTLPDSHGLETFRRLHFHAPTVPVIVLSGLDDEALAVDTVELGAQDYLVKGRVDARLLVRAIRYALKRIESEKELAEERNLLRNVINNLLDAIYVKDLRGCYRLDNIAHQMSLGVSSMEEVVGKTVFDFFPHEAAVHFQADDNLVIRTGKSIVNRHESVIDENGNKTWLATTKVPLRNRDGEIVGLVGIGRDITERKRSEEQLAHYNEQLRSKNLQLEDDLDMASEIQQAFLPQQFPSFPRSADADQSALQFFSKYLPTGAVGGDFFHVLPISDTKAGVFICDVMGHGVRAALVTAIQRALVEELSDVAEDPGEFLTRINAALISILRRTRTPMFASAFYLFIDVGTGELRFANAGHPKPLHVRRDEDKVVPLAAEKVRPGSALGVFANATYETLSAQAAPRDLVLLFTDGLYEVESAEGEYLDQPQLLEMVERRLSQPTGKIFDGLIEDVQQLSGARGFLDDVCLVGVEITRLISAATVKTSDSVQD